MIDVAQPSTTFQDELQRRALRIQARKRLTPFCQYTDPSVAEEYGAPHLKLLARYLEKVESGDIKRLMVFMPPRHWKTSETSVKLPQWFIGKRFAEGKPYSVMIASYSASLAQKEISEQSRNTIRDNELYREVFPEVRLARDATSSEAWKLRTRDNKSDEPYPAMVAVGVGGSAVGKGADLLIIDDPVKGMADAESAAIQDAQWKWFTATALKRLNPGGAVVLMMQRWAQRDLAGQILAHAANTPGAPQWAVLVLPALAYTEEERLTARRLSIPVPDKDPLGREPGEALWPEKYDRQYHLEQKALDEDSFAAVGQQMPSKPGGFLLGRDDFKKLDVEPSTDVRWVAGVDVAITQAQLSPKGRTQPDFTVCVKLGLWTPKGDKSDARLVIADMRYKQTKDPDLFIKDIMLEWGSSIPWYFAQDNVDKMVENALQRREDLIAHSMAVLPKIKGDKVVRSLPWRNRTKRGRVYVVNGVWNKWFFHCVELFPKGWPDDPIDAVSVAGAALGVKNFEMRKPRSYQG